LVPRSEGPFAEIIAIDESFLRESRFRLVCELLGLVYTRGDTALVNGRRAREKKSTAFAMSKPRSMTSSQRELRVGLTREFAREGPVNSRLTVPAEHVCTWTHIYTAPCAIAYLALIHHKNSFLIITRRCATSAWRDSEHKAKLRERPGFGRAMGGLD